MVLLTDIKKKKGRERVKGIKKNIQNKMTIGVIFLGIMFT